MRLASHQPVMCMHQAADPCGRILTLITIGLFLGLASYAWILVWIGLAAWALLLIPPLVSSTVMAVQRWRRQQIFERRMPKARIVKSRSKTVL